MIDGPGFTAEQKQYLEGFLSGLKQKLAAAGGLTVRTAADRCAGGFAVERTRATLRTREIAAATAADLLMTVQGLGLTSRGAGADNMRNITGSPAAGIDGRELFDTRPLTRALHHYILN